MKYFRNSLSHFSLQVSDTNVFFFFLPSVNHNFMLLLIFFLIASFRPFELILLNWALK